MPAPTIWQDEWVLIAYDMAREGIPEKGIAKALGISKPTFYQYKKKKKLFRLALRRGKEYATPKPGPGGTFQDYIFDRLSPEMQKVWEEITKVSKSKTGAERIEALLAQQGKLARQELFIYAWTKHNFSISKAMSLIGVARSTVEKWKKDPQFLELLEEIEWHKKNFFEDSLIQLVEEGNPSATIFINKTQNRDRGYGDKVEVEHTGTIEHQHQLISLEQLDLPLETQKEILAAIRKRKQVESVQVEALPA